ncbi:hypothetical protein JHK82_034959 [Glycine max]|nr:hypothetical protein JHK82_034959 [Glycine max]
MVDLRTHDDFGNKTIRVRFAISTPIRTKGAMINRFHSKNDAYKVKCGTRKLTWKLFKDEFSRKTRCGARGSDKLVTRH